MHARGTYQVNEISVEHLLSYYLQGIDSVPMITKDSTLIQLVEGILV